MSLAQKLLLDLELDDEIEENEEQLTDPAIAANAVPVLTAIGIKREETPVTAVKEEEIDEEEEGTLPVEGLSKLLGDKKVRIL